MVGACDVGLIFLDHRFTIPNFPSRLLAYMQAKLPVLAVTDPNTDIGKVIIEGGFGLWCESDDASQFAKVVERIADYDRCGMGNKGFEYLIEHYSVESSYQTIILVVA
jgi:glycosyltransferase involved in cell wall biosynthesis